MKEQTGKNNYELRIRAWDGKRMVFMSGLSIGLKKVKKISPYAYFSVDTFGSNVSLAKHEVMLWSGLTDFFGTDIYAKDIIRFAYEDKCEDGGIGYYIGVVEFEDGCFVVKEPNFTYDKHCMPQTLREWIQDGQCEVVGNVYQNKEYLDK